MKPTLKGFRLVDDIYSPLPYLPDYELALNSEVLGLELRVQSGELRFYDPETGRSLLSHLETEQARLAEQERSQKLAAKLRELGIDPETL